MPTRTELDKWDISKLRVWAGEIRGDSVYYEAQLHRMNTHFADIQWSGKAKDAAGDRCGGIAARERTQYCARQS
ncbi:hypothetical protein ACWF82_11550 [Nocardia sp. NPDC055053]